MSGVVAGTARLNVLHPTSTIALAYSVMENVAEQKRMEVGQVSWGVDWNSRITSADFIGHAKHKNSPDSKGEQIDSSSWWKELQSHVAEDMDTERSGKPRKIAINLTIVYFF